MLVLTRHVGKSVKIGSEVTVTVLAVKGHQIQLGIEAPKAMPVHRQEVFERIRRQGTEAPGARNG